MPLEWQVLMEGGQERGPLSLQELKRLVDFGQLRPETLVRPVGGAWQPAGTVAGLFPTASTMTQPAPLMGGQPPYPPGMPGAAPALVPMAPGSVVPTGHLYPATGPVSPVHAPGVAPSLPPLPPQAQAAGAFNNEHFPALAIGVVVLVLGGLFVCGMIAIATVKASLPKVAERKPQPRTASSSLPTRGLGNRPKEDSDRFRRFAEEASKVEWTPAGTSANAGVLAEIAGLERELRDASLPISKEFAGLERDYRKGRLTAEQYLGELRTLTAKLR